jgi:thioredoxin:protein disulfide reductase
MMYKDKQHFKAHQRPVINLKPKYLTSFQEVTVKSSRIFLLLTAIVFLTAPAMAQTSASVVKAEPGESVYKIKRGEVAKIEIKLEIEDEFHINSNRPNDKNLIATALKVERMTGLSVTPVLYPKAKMQKFEFSEKPLAVFEGKTTLRFTARALPSLQAGSHTIKAKLTVQACNNEKCLRPSTFEVAIPVEVM